MTSTGFTNLDCKSFWTYQASLTKILQVIIIIITLELILSFNTSQNIIFPKSSYKILTYYYYLPTYLPTQGPIKNPLKLLYILYNESKHNNILKGLWVVSKANKGKNTCQENGAMSTLDITELFQHLCLNRIVIISLLPSIIIIIIIMYSRPVLGRYLIFVF